MNVQKDHLSEAGHPDRQCLRAGGSRAMDNMKDRPAFDANGNRTWPVPQSAHRADAGPRWVMSSMHCALS